VVRLLRSVLVGTLTLAACTPAPQPPAQSAPVASDAPAGAYRLDRSHADLTFRVNHIGFSMYTGRFTDFDATLQFDPANPSAMRLEASVDVASLTLPAPPEGFVAEMLGPHWFDAAQFPTMTFRSTAVEPTGANTARVTGDLTLHGVTLPLKTEAHLALDECAVRTRVEFAIDRRAFGAVSSGGLDGVVSDNVVVRISLEAPRSRPGCPAEGASGDAP